MFSKTGCAPFADGLFQADSIPLFDVTFGGSARTLPATAAGVKSHRLPESAQDSCLPSRADPVAVPPQGSCGLRVALNPSGLRYPTLQGGRPAKPPAAPASPCRPGQLASPALLLSAPLPSGLPPPSLPKSRSARDGSRRRPNLGARVPFTPSCCRSCSRREENPRQSWCQTLSSCALGLRVAPGALSRRKPRSTTHGSFCHFPARRRNDTADGTWSTRGHQGKRGCRQAPIPGKPALAEMCRVCLHGA